MNLIRTKLMMNRQKIIHTLLHNRNCITGFALLLIILYHLNIVDRGLPLIHLFAFGFIGVDFFMFYSGYSLGYSLKTRGLKKSISNDLKEWRTTQIDRG